jgi:signal transduction histidine kinase
MSALVHSARRRLDTDRSGDELERGLALLRAGQALAEELAVGIVGGADVAAAAASFAADRRADPSAVSLALLAHAAHAPALLRCAPEQALGAVLELLCALAPLERVSLWTTNVGAVTCRLSLGASRPGPQARAAAQLLLDPFARTPTEVHEEIVTGAVTRAGQPVAAVVGRASTGGATQAEAFVSIACAALEPLLDRAELLGRVDDGERTLVSAHERRLTRLGFDLHDGPLQDVAVLAGDLRTARRRAAQELERPVRERVVGVFDDLIVRVTELDGGLRTMAQSLEGASVVRRPLVDVIRREIDQLESRAAIPVELHATGDLDGLSDSQQIALFRVVQEALTNAREHSRASSVRVTLVATGACTTLEIVDDGVGFEPETTLQDATDRGRLGLLGAAERVRLLGGALSVSSRPGIGTRLSVSLPRWRAVEPVPA